MIKQFKNIMLMVVGIGIWFLFSLNVSASEYKITSDMSQEEIDTILAGITSEDIVTIDSGDYSTVKNDKNYHKIITVSKDNSTFSINGTYTELQFIIQAKGAHIIANDAIIVGNASTKQNPSAAIFVEQGDVTLDGNLILSDHNHAIRLGYTNAPTTVSSKFVLSEYASLTVKDNVITNSSNYYGKGYDDPDSLVYNSPVDQGQGNGTSGSGIDIRGKGYTNFTMMENSKFYALGNARAGIFSINVTNFTYDMLPNSYALFQNNAQGICMNTDFSGSVNINLDAARMDVLDNKSNGITGQSLPYVLNLKNNSEVTLNNNAIAINNFYIIMDKSKLTAVNNRTHGITNVAIDATDSIIDISNNAFLGLNITKYNDEKTSTDILRSTITANNNGGAGIRFYINSGVTNITDSTIITNGNGYGEEIYGFSVKPNDSAYWAGVVAKGDLYALNSVMMSDGVSGYALYDTKDGSATFHVLENAVLTLNGEESKDVFDDYNSSMGNTGHTVVVGGSLQADTDNISKSDKLSSLYENEQNPTIPSVSGDKDDVQFSVPINEDYTALTQFTLNQDINKVVGGEGSHTFTYFDPNTLRQYDYTFRYNTLGEDLDEDVAGKAYVWTPVSVLKYDATEGVINYLGTAGKVSFGSSVTDGKTGLATRYTQDVTIFGNCMNLAEKTLASAEREGYVFLGWYIADDNLLALEYANSNNFEELYKLLNTEFTVNTKLAVDNIPVDELIVYAKWGEKNIGSTEPEIIPPKTNVEYNQNLKLILMIMINLSNLSLISYAIKRY